MAKNLNEHYKLLCVIHTESSRCLKMGRLLSYPCIIGNKLSEEAQKDLKILLT